jgi:putative FmdB family regulatory protein
MPTYEYECENCSRRFEKFQALSDPAVKDCPECGGAVRRLIGTGGGVIFKGGGTRGGSHGHPGGHGTGCNRSRPCCGRDEPCGEPPCKD